MGPLDDSVFDRQTRTWYVPHLFGFGCPEAWHGVTDSCMDDPGVSCSLACTVVVAVSPCTFDSCKCTILRPAQKPALSSQSTIYFLDNRTTCTCVCFPQLFWPGPVYPWLQYVLSDVLERTTCMFGHVCVCMWICLPAYCTQSSTAFVTLMEVHFAEAFRWKCILSRLAEVVGMHVSGAWFVRPYGAKLV